MTSTTQKELYKTFLEVSGKQASSLDEMATSLAGVVAKIDQTQTAPTAASASNNKTQTVSTPAASSGSVSGGVGSTIESIATTVLKSGFGIVPLVGELLGLFSGGDSTPPPALVKYAMPAKLDFEGAETASGLTNADYGQSGLPRTFTMGPATGNGGTGGGGATPNSATSGGAPQITVNVQAMDARSFLDRSSDIAAAVRDAMLNLNSINDVVNDL